MIRKTKVGKRENKENEDRPVIGTVQTGKHPVYTIVIDGVNYKLEKLEKE